MKITKTIKFPISYHEEMQTGDKVLSFKEFCREAWDCQREVRNAMNAVSSAYKVQVEREIAFCNENGRWPNKEEKKGGFYSDESGKPISFETLLDHAAVPYLAKIGSSHVYGTINAELPKWNKSKKDFISGQMAYPQFKSNQPILIKKGTYEFERIAQDVITVSFSIFSDSYRKYLGLKSGIFTFRCDPSIKDKGTKAILHKIMDGTYQSAAGKLSYDSRNKKWVFSCTYSFEKDTDGIQLDPNKILGVDLGFNTVAYCAVSGSPERFFISGDKVKEFRRRVEQRRIAMLKALPYQHGGKVGHGTKCRVEKPYDAEGKIARFRETENKNYAADIVNFAVKNGCSVIQLENLSGVRDTAPDANEKKKKAKGKGKKKSTDEAQIAMIGMETTEYPDNEKKERKKENRMLGRWTFYDLKQRIEMKAKEYGIVVSVVNPAYTSQRCSHCGYISHESRPDKGESHKWFTCVKCGKHLDADYNAAVNLSIAGIEEIIKEQLEGQKAVEEKLKALSA